MSAPLCNICRHNHEQGVVCPVCGHKGKGKVFKFMIRSTEPSDVNLHFEAFVTTDDVFECRESFVRILRQRIFGMDDVYLTPEDQTSRHIMGFIGDAPATLGRWRIDQNTAVVDLIGVLEPKRRQQFGCRTLDFIIQDIKTTISSMNQPIQGIVATVPASETDPAYKMCVKLGFAAAGLVQDGKAILMRL